MRGWKMQEFASARILALPFSAESIIENTSFNIGWVHRLLYKVQVPRWVNNIVR